MGGRPIVAKARSGTDPALDKQLARNAITLGELVQLRLDEKELSGELEGIVCRATAHDDETVLRGSARDQRQAGRQDHCR